MVRLVKKEVQTNKAAKEFTQPDAPDDLTLQWNSMGYARRTGVEATSAQGHFPRHHLVVQNETVSGMKAWNC